MNKTELLAELKIIEGKAAILREIINAPEKKSAEQWITDFLNENAKKWRVEMGDRRQVWYLEDQWIFDLDLKRKCFWCYYYKFWQILEKRYGMKYDDIQNLIKNQVLKHFICEGFIYIEPGFVSAKVVLKHFNK